MLVWQLDKRTYRVYSLCCNSIRQSLLPPQRVYRAVAKLLAKARYCDELPLYRQALVYLEVSRYGCLDQVSLRVLDRADYSTRLC